MVSSTSQVSFVLLMLLCAATFNRSISCNDKDRRLLLNFKQGVVDPSNRLSSWSTEQGCCAWRGVACGFNTSRVTNLLLQNPNSNGSESLGGELNLSSLLELEFLRVLDLSFNDFERISMSSINNSVVAHGHPPANFSMLSFLDLSYNIHLEIDNLHWLSQLSSLESLRLNGIHCMETNWVQSLASLPSLDRLELEDCHFTGFIPSVMNVNFSSLSTLSLALNDFKYGLPNWLFNLSNEFSYLDLSQCSLRGQIPDFSSYRNLTALILSNNKLEGSIPDWLGQLDHLQYLDLSNNLFHGSIPSSLKNSSALSILDISFNDLSGTLPKSLEQTSVFLDLSHNSISGDISNSLLASEFIFLSFNKFEGRLPHISASVVVLDLARNSFSGPLSPLLCHNESEQKYLQYLDISNNFLTEELPDCWSNWRELSYIYLGSNKLSGEVPLTMGSVLELKSLDLRNNGFFGDIPWTFRNYTSLVLINLEGNNFSGSITKWMQQSLSVMQLRSNQFTGNIPPELCSLPNLIILDLADNKLSGPIPHCLYNLTCLVSGLPNNALSSETGSQGAGKTGYTLKIDLHSALKSQVVRQTTLIDKTGYTFKIDLYTKGQQLEYVKNLKLVRSIDLSANKLYGEIPPQLFWLNKLQSLNLSHNHLTGKIPEQMGRMKELESLDFSHNNFQGKIPQSMSSLSFLGVLNLSYNNFSGQIPLGTQLQSFDAWSYTGNPELCGAPLQKNCTIQEQLNNTKLVEGNDGDTFLKSLYLGMGVGFAVGFWVVCGSLFLNRAWRHTYFRFFDGVVDRIYVAVAIKLRRFH